MPFIPLKTHTGQDYYAHAMQRTGTVNAPGRIEGSPTNIPANILPASWMGTLARGTHGPNYSSLFNPILGPVFGFIRQIEPAYRAQDTGLRVQGAEEWTVQALNKYLTTDAVELWSRVYATKK